MNLGDFTDQQRQALLDLFVLGMYADGHLAAAEDTQARRLLGELGFDSVQERNRQFDAAVARIRAHTQDKQVHARTLAQNFATPEQRRRVLDLLAELMASDDKVSGSETLFLGLLKRAFEM